MCKVTCWVPQGQRMYRQQSFLGFYPNTVYNWAGRIRLKHQDINNTRENIGEMEQGKEGEGGERGRAREKETET